MKKRLNKIDKEIEITRIKSLNNIDLLDETLDWASGDDYYGEFTESGLFIFNELKKELENRLKDWLNENNERIDNSYIS